MYNISGTVNYPDAEAEIKPRDLRNIFELQAFVQILLQDETATSFVITIVKAK